MGEGWRGVGSGDGSGWGARGTVGILGVGSTPSPHRWREGRGAFADTHTHTRVERWTLHMGILYKVALVRHRYRDRVFSKIAQWMDGFGSVE